MKYNHHESEDRATANHHTTALSDAETKQSPWPLIISLCILALLLGCYFLWPAFQQFLNHAYQVLTSDDKQRITQWVSQFGAWGPLLIILAMIAQMFLFVIPSVLVMVVTILAYGPVWGTVLTIAGVLTPPLWAMRSVLI